MDSRGHHLCANEAKTAGWASSARHSTTNQEQRAHIAERYISRRELRALFHSFRHDDLALATRSADRLSYAG